MSKAILDWISSDKLRSEIGQANGATLSDQPIRFKVKKGSLLGQSRFPACLFLTRVLIGSL